MQMKMFLTRLGENSKMIVTGDPSQIDLPPGQTSGLVEAMNLLHGVSGIGEIRFTSADVIRHPLVARIVDAYDTRFRDEKPGRGRLICPLCRRQLLRARQSRSTSWSRRVTGRLNPHSLLSPLGFSRCGYRGNSPGAGERC